MSKKKRIAAFSDFDTLADWVAENTVGQ